MTHKLTKFQQEVWNKLKPHFNEGNYGSEITFDDELKVTFTMERGSIVLTIFPNEDILYTLIRNSGGFETQFFRLNSIDELIKTIQKV